MFTSILVEQPNSISAVFFAAEKGEIMVALHALLVLSIFKPVGAVLLSIAAGVTANMCPGRIARLASRFSLTSASC